MLTQQGIAGERVIVQILRAQQLRYDADTCEENQTERCDCAQHGRRHNSAGRRGPEDQRVKDERRGEYYAGLKPASGTIVTMELNVEGEQQD